MIRLRRGRGGAAWLVAAWLTVGASGGAGAAVAGPDAKFPVPDGWSVRSERTIDDYGTGIDVLEDTSGAVVRQWWRSTAETVLVQPSGRGSFVYTHRFDSPEHARHVWLGVLRLAEEPDVALPPRVLELAPDTLAYGVASQTAGTDLQVLAEELHRVVGDTVVIFVIPNADIAASLPSPSMLELLAAHREAFPQTHFDLPRPATGGDSTAAAILFGVLVVAGTVIVVSTVILLRRRAQAD